LTHYVDEFLLAEFSATHTEVLAVASEGFAVVVDVGARADPIHLVCVRFDFKSGDFDGNGIKVMF
jgi:hypothetical protein